LARQLGFAKCDFLLVVLAALRGGTVRQVVGSEDGAVAPRAKEADAARQHGFAGSADEQGQPEASAAVDVGQAGADGLVGTVGHQECDIGQEGAVEPAFEHGGEAFQVRRMKIRV